MVVAPDHTAPVGRKTKRDGAEIVSVVGQIDAEFLIIGHGALKIGTVAPEIKFTSLETVDVSEEMDIDSLGKVSASVGKAIAAATEAFPSDADTISTHADHLPKKPSPIS